MPENLENLRSTSSTRVDRVRWGRMDHIQERQERAASLPATVTGESAVAAYWRKKREQRLRAVRTWRERRRTGREKARDTTGMLTLMALAQFALRLAANRESNPAARQAKRSALLRAWYSYTSRLRQAGSRAGRIIK